MARRELNKLTDKQCAAPQAKRRVSDGGGLYLSVSPNGSKSWTFVWYKAGRPREAGLGPYPAVPLKAARKIASEMREAVAAGGDPIAERKDAAGQAEEEMTFGAVADAFVDAMAPEWSNPKHVEQWRMTLGDAYCLKLRKKPVAAVETTDVLAVLKPIWGSKPETASRIRGRVERVLDRAKAEGLRGGENPARWRGHLEHMLPARKKLTRGHHAAMPYADVPAFLTILRDMPGLGARALELTIITAARSGEVLNARWDEFDLTARVWTIPADRMKARRPHRAPLTEPAIKLLNELRSEHGAGDFVFPGQRAGRPLSNLAMTAVLRRAKKLGVTVHGFRSAFRDWAAEETDHAREIAEAALAHVVGDATERAYRRGDGLEKRRVLMRDWSGFLLEGKQDA